VHHLLHSQLVASTTDHTLEHMLARELTPEHMLARELTRDHTVLASTVERQLQQLLVSF